MTAFASVLMILAAAAAAAAATPWTAAAFSPAPCLGENRRVVAIVDRGVSPLMMGYAPDGMTPEQYRKLREKEKTEQNAKNLGAYGPRSFQSRSLRSFQEDLEKGKAGHLMPVFNAKQKLAAGKIKAEDIPYMQRLGSWDNRDLGGKAKKVEGNKWDKVYNNVDGAPAKFDWTGTGQRTGPRQPGAAAAKSNPQAKGGEEPPKKKFGWF